jgi:hypothetical protein
MISLDAVRVQDTNYFDLEAIRSQDPLNADLMLAHLPEMNRRADSGALVALLRQLAERALAETIATPEAAFAAMRDIGIVLGSLKRHGIEPVAAVPEIEPILVQLGKCTNMVPRDTVHHYTSWNPLGERRRSYTGEEQEFWLQDAVTAVFPSLSASLAVSDVLSTMSPNDARFGPLVAMLVDATGSMVNSIDSVTKRVSPVFFAQVLRPYFEEITVAGQVYLGPAAAQAPLWLIDLCAWASDRNAPDYQAFLLESVHYSLPAWRAFHERHRNNVSLVSKVEQAMQMLDGEADANLTLSGTSLTELLTVLKVFRGRHMGIAQRAYSEEVALYTHGSGGAPVPLLKHILNLTRENEALLKVRTRKSPPPPPPALREPLAHAGGMA